MTRPDFKHCGYVLRHASLEPRGGSRASGLTRQDRERVREELRAYVAAEPSLDGLVEATEVALAEASFYCTSKRKGTNAPGYLRHVYESLSTLHDLYQVAVFVSLRGDAKDITLDAYEALKKSLTKSIAEFTERLRKRPAHAAAAAYAVVAANTTLRLSRRSARLDAELGLNAEAYEPLGGN